MAEILLEPSSRSKIIPLSFNLNDTSASNAAQLMTKRQFNTADTDAWFQVTLDGFFGTAGSFDITLFNLNDKSVFNHTGKPFTTNPFYYKLDSESDETTNEIRHAGRWIGQIVVTLANGDSATRKFIFDIEGHILDGADVQTILLEDYNALIATINTSKDLLTQYNVDYAALLVDLAAAETARTATYNQLVADQQANIDAFDVALDTGIVAANLATKLQDFEATNNSRLLSAERQLAEAQAQIDLNKRGLGETISSLALLNSTYPTGDTRDHIVAGNIAEVDTLTVTAIPTVASTITITLNGVAKTVAVDPAIQTTTDLVATAIRAAGFIGWTIGGTMSVVTFTAMATGAKAVPTFSGGTTGVTATFAITVKGENANFHRYFWDGTWKDGGAYQAIELSNNSVFNPNLSQPLQDYFELYKSYKNVGVSYKGTSDPASRTWYGLAMLCHSVSVFTKIGIRLTPLNLMGTEYTAELRSGANFNTLLATATGVKQTSGYEFVTFDFGKNFSGDVYVCIKTADGQAPSLDASFLNSSMVTTTDQRYNIASPGGPWVSLSGGYNAYLKIEFYTDEYATEAQNLLSRVGQVESEILMIKNDLFSPLMHTILGIGDSLTAGAYDLDALTTTIYPNASYLAMISRLKNVAIVNKGSSGSTTNDYRTLHDADIVACNASAVVIWLGVNDVLKGANAFNGSVADVQGSDYTFFPNTSAGNLGYIIKRAKARNPNAKIFVCNMLKWFNGGTVVTNLNAANGTIAAVTDYLDAYLIDLNTLSGLSYALNRAQCFGVSGVHLTEYGYAVIADTVTNVITDVIKNNLADFRYTNMALN